MVGHYGLYVVPVTTSINLVRVVLILLNASELKCAITVHSFFDKSASDIRQIWSHNKKFSVPIFAVPSSILLSTWMQKLFFANLSLSVKGMASKS